VLQFGQIQPLNAVVSASTFLPGARLSILQSFSVCQFTKDVSPLVTPLINRSHHGVR
jgi:hypothetical protein